MLFLVLRSMHVTLAVGSTALGYGSYRRPGLAVACALAVCLESAWVVSRLWSRPSFDQPILVFVEVIFGVVGMLVLAGALDVEDLTSFINWMLPYGCGIVAGAAIAVPSWRLGAAATAVVALTYGIVVRRNLTLSGAQAATAFANIAEVAAYYLVTALVARSLRRAAAETVLMQQTAVEQASLLAGTEAAAKERDGWHRLVHDSALQTLEALAKDPAVPARARNDARREAARVRSILRDQVPDAGLDLVGALATVVEEFAGAGLNVELVAAEVHESPSTAVVDALAGAAREALRNVLKHAQVNRVVVRAAADGSRTEVTIRDYGKGADFSTINEGFGIPNCIRRPLHDVGGQAHVRSAPGDGTLVTLRLDR